METDLVYEICDDDGRFFNCEQDLTAALSCALSELSDEFQTMFVYCSELYPEADTMPCYKVTTMGVEAIPRHHLFPSRAL